MTLDMSDVVECPEFIEDDDIVIIRNSGAGYDNDGLPTSGTDEEISITGIVTKVTAKEIVQMELGEYKGEKIKIITSTEILTSKEDAQSDRIKNWKGDQFKVVAVDDNSSFGFYRAYAVYEGIETA